MPGEQPWEPSQSSREQWYAMFHQWNEEQRKKENARDAEPAGKDQPKAAERTKKSAGDAEPELVQSDLVAVPQASDFEMALEHSPAREYLGVVQEQLGLKSVDDALVVGSRLSAFLVQEIGRGARVIVEHKSGARSELIIKTP